MNTGIQPQALINGNINFFPSLSTGISAARILKDNGPDLRF
jgi:hypothetical protein